MNEDRVFRVAKAGSRWYYILQEDVDVSLSGVEKEWETIEEVTLAEIQSGEASVVKADLVLLDELLDESEVEAEAEETEKVARFDGTMEFVEPARGERI